MASFLTHPIPAVVILLGLLVIVHELGHFLVGKWSGIAVEIFSIGFGPAIVRFTRGDTDYRISWIPLGGYVKFYGASPSEEVPEHIRGREFVSAPLSRRAMVAAAGPVANFLLAIAAYMALGMAGISHPRPVIGEIMEGGAAQRAGLQFEDEIKAVDGKPIRSWQDLEKIIQKSPSKTMHLLVARNGKPINLDITPDSVPATDMAGRPISMGRAGIARGNLPATVSVTAADSAAAKAGIKSGDEITSMASTGAPTKILYWRQFLQLLDQAVADPKIANLTLTVRSAPVTEEVSISAGNERTVTLPLSAARGVLAAKHGGQSEAEQLGMVDSQLLVAQPQENLQGVLQRGDRILKWDATPVKDVFALHEVMIVQPDAKVNLTVMRDFKTIQIPITLKAIEVQKPSGKANIFTLPIVFWGQPAEPEPWVEIYHSPLQAFMFGVSETVQHSGELVGTIGGLITRDIPLKALGGPMLIAKIAGDSAKQGWQSFVNSLALISINLGMLNLFPIPVLDGGQLVIMGIEAIRRRPLAESAIENFQKVGFVMVMALVVLATYNDFSRFWTSMLQSMRGIFQ